MNGRVARVDHVRVELFDDELLHSGRLLERTDEEESGRRAGHLLVRVEQQTPQSAHKAGVQVVADDQRRLAQHEQRYLIEREHMVGHVVGERALMRLRALLHAQQRVSVACSVHLVVAGERGALLVGMRVRRVKRQYRVTLIVQSKQKQQRIEPIQFDINFGR